MGPRFTADRGRRVYAQAPACASSQLADLSEDSTAQLIDERAAPITPAACFEYDAERVEKGHC
jgi:hypothetical protein